MIKNKIKKIKDLSQIVKRLKKSHKVIAFTNGCFDIMHAGHVRYLEAAKKKCDILIVGVNSDSSTKKVKNKKRPIIKEKGRTDVLAALESVDYVATFKEETPLKLIKMIEPDILVKGGDWKKKDIVGSDFLKSYGGKIITIPYLRGYSTTSIIKSIAKKFK